MDQYESVSGFNFGSELGPMGNGWNLPSPNPPPPPFPPPWVDAANDQWLPINPNDPRGKGLIGVLPPKPPKKQLIFPDLPPVSVNDPRAKLNSGLIAVDPTLYVPSGCTLPRYIIGASISPRWYGAESGDPEIHNIISIHWHYTAYGRGKLPATGWTNSWGHYGGAFSPNPGTSGVDVNILREELYFTDRGKDPNTGPLLTDNGYTTAIVDEVDVRTNSDSGAGNGQGQIRVKVGGRPGVIHQWPNPIFGEGPNHTLIELCLLVEAFRDPDGCAVVRITQMPCEEAERQR